MELSSLDVAAVSQLLTSLKLSHFVNKFVDNQVDGETLCFVESVAEITDLGINILSKAKILHSKLVQFQSTGVPRILLEAESSFSSTPSSLGSEKQQVYLGQLFEFFLV